MKFQIRCNFVDGRRVMGVACRTVGRTDNENVIALHQHRKLGCPAAK